MSQKLSKVILPNKSPVEDFTGVPVEDGDPATDPQPTIEPTPSY